MTVEQEIRLLIQDAVSNQAEFDPVKFLSTISAKLRQACATGGECDSAGPNFLGSQGAYFAAAEFLSQKGFFSAAEQLLLGWWNDVGARQLDEQKHVYRANSAYKLTQLYLRQSDFGAGLRWALLTQADDLLNEHPDGGGAGKQWLRTIFGASESELNDLNSVADENLDITKSGNAGTSKAHRFAEDIIVRFTLRDISCERFFSQPSLVRELYN